MGNSLTLVREVDVLGNPVPVNVTAADFGAKMDVVVQNPDQYRLVSEAGPLTEWTAFDAGTTSVTVGGIPRDGNKTKYTIWVERMSNGIKYPFTVELK